MGGKESKVDEKVHVNTSGGSRRTQKLLPSEDGVTHFSSTLESKGRELAKDTDGTYSVRIGFLANDSTLAKRELISRYVNGVPYAYCDMKLHNTINLDFLVKHIQVPAEPLSPAANLSSETYIGFHKVKVIVYFLGRERFRTITNSTLRQLDGLVGMYSTTSDYSLNWLKALLDEASQHTSDSCPLAIVADTIHEETHPTEVPREKGEKFAMDHGAVAFTETCSNDMSDRIDKLMEALITEIFRVQP
tara:strand:- start:1675 stop:2415 length:741 start_codon:yes stop_codon:yes gene_type:complete